MYTLRTLTVDTANRNQTHLIWRPKNLLLLLLLLQQQLKIWDIFFIQFELWPILSQILLPWQGSVKVKF